jgi:hypothetical protein
MSAPVTPAAVKGIFRGPGARVRGAFLVCAVVFAWAVTQFHDPRTGFTSLLMIGDAIDARTVTRLREAPHYVYEDSAGYDGAYYVQLALYPTLNNPELKDSIDNLPYRARRALFGWISWGLGLGQPSLVVQAQSLLNVFCWFALGWVLMRWFPPNSWENFMRWFGLMFSHGVCMSVRDSLVDGPALLLVALAMRWAEEGRRGPAIGMLALGGLGKETSLLAVMGLAQGVADGDRRSLRRFVAAGAIVAAPLLLWMAYVRWKFGPVEDPGLGNFTWPLRGLAEKWGAVIHDLVADPSSRLLRATAAAVVGVTVQLIFFLTRWQPREAWWRIGATFAVMTVVLSTPVWEGYPGAFTRVVLPMLLAFNIVIPRGRRWLPVLLAGNLSVFAGFSEFSPPPREFVQLEGGPALVAKVQIKPVGWYGREADHGRRWRWSAGSSSLLVRNSGSHPVVLKGRGQARAASEARTLLIRGGAGTLWSGQLGESRVAVEFEWTAEPGETTLSFETDRPPNLVGADPRLLAFSVSDLEIVVQPASGHP